MRTLNDVPRRLVIAIGGNAVHPEDIRGTSDEQKDVAQKTAEALLPLAQLDNELVITHGNGPVVGKIMMRQMLTMNRIPPMDLDICVAHSQGGIGYLLMQAIENALREKGNPRHVASLLTQVEVDKDDPAFNNPTKFVGPFFHGGRGQEDQRRTQLGDAGGFRPRLAPRRAVAEAEACLRYLACRRAGQARHHRHCRRRRRHSGCPRRKGAFAPACRRSSTRT